MPVTDFDILREKAVKYLGLRRAKSSGQLRLRLAKETTDQKLIEEVISYLEEIDYINDKRAGLQMAKSYTGRRGRSRFAIQYELTGKGVKREIAEEIAAELPDDFELALDLLHAHFLGREDVDPEKMSNLLQRRGFSYFVISETIAKWQRDK